MKTLSQTIPDLLWHERWKTAAPLTRAVIHVLRYPYAVVRDALLGELNMRAMSLVYTTLLSLVPLIALSFSLLKAFDFHYEVEPLLNNLLSPLGSEAPVITSRIIQFVENVKGSTLGSIGFALLIYTVFSMVQKVEESFNHVWQVTRTRSLARRFSEYLSVIVVAPVLMLIAIGLIGTLSADSITSKLLKYEWVAESTIWLSRWMPLLFISAAFSFVYGLIPNTRVTVKAAVIGGIVGGVIWTLAGELFAALVVGSTRTTAIYSTFAIMIVALIWLYLGWLILLIGAKLSFYIQNPHYLRHGQRRIELGNAMREELALGLMTRVAAHHQGRYASPTVNDIAQELGITGDMLAPISAKLEKSGLLLKTEDNGLVPAMDSGEISLLDVLDAVRDVRSADVADSQIDATMNTINEAIATSLEGQTLRTLIATEQPPNDARE
ncbi:MAG: YihY family inner membrane protein [Gammaproteobacteria bacterium]|nr:YihY family inner membrane protein [Gammaproteobacteria bacterium]